MNRSGKINEILDKAKAFCKDHNITSDCVGIHLRMTDFNNNISIDNILSKVSSTPDQKYFICSWCTKLVNIHSA